MKEDEFLTAEDYKVLEEVGYVDNVEVYEVDPLTLDNISDMVADETLGVNL